MWLHGGYTTFFPYISSDGAGSDYGTTVSMCVCVRVSLRTPACTHPGGFSVYQPGHTRPLKTFPYFDVFVSNVYHAWVFRVWFRCFMENSCSAVWWVHA